MQNNTLRMEHYTGFKVPTSDRATLKELGEIKTIEDVQAYLELEERKELPLIMKKIVEVTKEQTVPSIVGQIESVAMKKFPLDTASFMETVRSFVQKHNIRDEIMKRHVTVTEQEVEIATNTVKVYMQEKQGYTSDMMEVNTAFLVRNTLEQAKLNYFLLKENTIAHEK